MRSEGFLFLSGGLGRDRVRSGFGNAFVHACETVPICLMRCALRIGLYWGCLVGVRGRFAEGIGGGRVVSNALCRWDWWGGRRVGNAVLSHSLSERSLA